MDVKVISADLSDEALWFLSRTCALCSKRVLEMYSCERCTWIHYCCVEHRREDYELHSQRCVTPGETSVRGLTTQEIREEQALIIHMTKTAVLPSSRLRESQQRRLHEWSQWFFIRTKKVCLIAFTLDVDRQVNVPSQRLHDELSVQQLLSTQLYSWVLTVASALQVCLGPCGVILSYSIV